MPLSESGGILEQTHFQVVRGIDKTTIYQHFTVRQAHNQAAVNDV